MKRLTLYATLGLAVALGSCDSGPKAGDLAFSLATPNQDDGAIAFRLTTDGVQEIAAVAAACTGCQVFVADGGQGTDVRGILVGDVVAGPVLRVTVSDVKTPGAYTATVLEVAARDYALRPTGEYALTAAN